MPGVGSVMPSKNFEIIVKSFHQKAKPLVWLLPILDITRYRTPTPYELPLEICLSRLVQSVKKQRCIQDQQWLTYPKAMAHSCLLCKNFECSLMITEDKLY